MKIHPEGKKIIPVALLIYILLSLACFFFLGKYLIFIFLLAGFTVLMAMAVWFFREPQRAFENLPGQVISVCDGEVVAIEPHFEREYFKEERIQVSVFMSVFNVHINFVPAEGEIIYRHHRNGRFLPAFIAKSSEDNERCTTVVRTKEGKEILIRQIAGLMARRVITYKNTGDNVAPGQQLGFIRFGSRVDLFLPMDANIKVKLHQKTVGGKTVIATFN